MPVRGRRPLLRRGLTGFLAAALPLAGCAAYQPEPLATSHPAHPAAAVAPDPPPSATLAVTAADVASIRPAPPAAGRPPAPGARPPGPVLDTAVGEGEVVATVPASGQIVLEHGEIKGFMDAMTMGYRVEPASLLGGVNPGDKVRFTIDVGRRAIVAIEKLP